MKKLILIVTSLILLTSCARTQSGVSSAFFVTSWNDTVSGAVDNSVIVEKTGEACAINILGIAAIGDSSVEAAKKAGRIDKVAFVDTKYLGILGSVFQQGCTVVKGK